MVSETRISVKAKNSRDSSREDHEEPSHPALELLCEVRDASARDLNTRLSAAGLDDLAGNDLLFMMTIWLRVEGAAEKVAKLRQRVGISPEAADQSVATLIQRGYLKSPGDPGQPAVVPTERGLAAFNKARKALEADRWAEFPFRSGDIVISTLPKSGTTWMQMICALLIFQTPGLPAGLQDLSPWLEGNFGGRSGIYAKLAAQQHRRFIKTHSLLYEIPADPRVTYIVVARNPLDSTISGYFQRANKGHQDLPQTRQWLLGKIDEMGEPDNDLDNALRHISYAWERRNEPNIVLVHYEDLSADLPGEMRRLAARLDITVPEDKWPALVEAATFKEMQAAAEQLQPVPVLRQRGVSERFFRRGSSGEGRALLTEDEAARYGARAARIASPELLAWLHRDDKP
jgi:hypothetical protein